MEEKLSSISFAIRCLRLFNDNLFSVVVTTVLTDPMGHFEFMALGALHDTRRFQLPNAAASLISSRSRNLSLWYCHIRDTSLSFPLLIF